MRADRSVITAARDPHRTTRRGVPRQVPEPSTPARSASARTGSARTGSARTAPRRGPAESASPRRAATATLERPDRAHRSRAGEAHDGRRTAPNRNRVPEPSAGAGVGAALVVALVATVRGLARLVVRLVHLVVDAFLEVTHPARSESTTARRAAERVPVADSRRRLIAVVAAGAVLFAIIAVRLAGLQLVEPDQLEAYGMAQRMRVQNVAADRGTITDRNGVELAVSAPQRSVFVDPALIEDPSAEAAQLARVLGVEAGPIEAAMRADNRFGYIARHVDDDVAAEVEALALPGVAFLSEPKRFTPSGDIARSIVGSTDVDGNGISGIEAQYGDLLTGTPGKVVFEQTPDGNTIPVGEHEVIEAQRGHDVRLTLDRGLQFEVERILGDAVLANGARAGTVIVAKPDTGEILAMANMVNDRDSGTVVPSSNNEALTTVIEPGSVMKVVAAAGAIEDGHVTPDTRVTVPDAIQFGPDVIKEHDFHGTVSWSVAEILQRSSNTGTIRLAQMLGKERLYEYLKTFGFATPTGLGFPNEAIGYLPKPADWWDSSMGTIPIGQGVSVSALQMLGAYNVIANGGVYLPPRLVASTVGPDGTVTPTPMNDGRRVVSDTTADQMNLMLRNVISAEGTAAGAYVPGYTVAGKTGTARKPQPNGTYTDENGVTQYTAAFVGFAPAEAPAVTVIVIIDEPSGGAYYGGLVAAPVFSQVTQYALQVLGIQPPATDAPAGGTAARPEVQAEAARHNVAGTGVQVGADGKVRAPAAVDADAVPAGGTGTTAPADGSTPTTAPGAPPPSGAGTGSVPTTSTPTGAPTAGAARAPTGATTSRG